MRTTSEIWDSNSNTSARLKGAPTSELHIFPSAIRCYNLAKDAYSGIPKFQDITLLSKKDTLICCTKSEIFDERTKLRI